MSKTNQELNEKGALSEQIRDLDQQIDELRREADDLAIKFKNCFEEVDARQSELNDLVQRADREAAMMRDCFERATAAYSSGGGAEAKGLSLEGKEHQREAEHLNRSAQEIRDKGKLGKKLERCCKEINRRIHSLVQKRKSLQSVARASRSLGRNLSVMLDRHLSEVPDGTRERLAEFLRENPEGMEQFFRGLANPELNHEMARALPGALVDILSTHPSTSGLLVSLHHRGPGAQAWVKNLTNPSIKGSADGTAYELLAARRLRSVAAGNLRILPSDRLSFGSKQQARYEPSPLKSKELLTELMSINGSNWKDENAKKLASKTVEADLLINRGTKEISVDFKYTKSNMKNLETRQLLGLAVALATGEITSAHFVCNTKFGWKTQARVDDINRVMTRWHAGTITLNSNYTWW